MYRVILTDYKLVIDNSLEIENCELIIERLARLYAEPKRINLSEKEILVARSFKIGAKGD